LKVSVEKPDAALLARIAKARAESAARMRGRGDRGGQGYSGNLHRGGPGAGREGGLGRTGGHLSPGTRPGRTGGAFEPPKDIYALRAQSAGVTGNPGGPGGKDRRGPGGPGGP